MKTRIIILLLILLYVTMQGLATEPRKIIIRGDEAFPPYEFINDKGEPDGFNVDLTRAVMKELNLPYDLQLGDWTKALQQFENKEVDLITGVAKSEIPDKRFYLSKPHSYVDYIIVDRKSVV